MNLRSGRTLSVAAALVLVAAVGCTDPTVAPKSTVSNANIWSDQASYSEYMAKLYGGLILTSQSGPNENCDKCGDIKGIDEGFSEYLRLYWYLEEVPTDEAAIGWGDAGLHELNVHSWNSTDQMVVAMYYRVFFQVTLANEFLRQTTIDKLDARGVGTALKATIQNYRAEARFLRALAYAHGLDLFGPIPLTTEANTVGSIPSQVSRDSIYNYAVSELLAIRDSLPARSALTYGRATPAAANMLLAELYLNAGVYTGTPHYDLALSAAAAVIGTPGLSLNTVFRNNFTSDNNLSPEIIFSAVQDGLHTQTWGGMTFLVHAGCGGDMQASWYGMDYCWGGYRIKPQALALFGAGDSRGAFIFDSTAAFDTTTAWRTADSLTLGADTAGDPGHPLSGNHWRGIDSTFTREITKLSDWGNGWGAPKFTNFTSTGGAAQQLGMIDTDFPIFRLAEAYLIYAEAQVRGGGGGQALTYLNQLRERAYGNASHDFAAVPPLDTILAERGRELLFEAKRRTDLIRFGKFTGGTYLWSFKGGVAGGTSIADFYSLYPLPANELAANPSLTQNPGY